VLSGLAVCSIRFEKTHSSMKAPRLLQADGELQSGLSCTDDADWSQSDTPHLRTGYT
jgi:hypothetical protein